MSYFIIPLCFSPKLHEYQYKPEPPKIHCISYDKCNFNCEYCFVKNRNIEARYLDLNEKEYEFEIDKLFEYGYHFKFTGGEPTINPNLIHDLTYIKNKGGIVYLDTNGSNPILINQLLQLNLIDILAVSLKGLSVSDSLKVTHLKKSYLCWDNVFECLANSSNNYNIKVIATYVCDNTFDDDAINKLASLLSKYPNIILKINNYIKPENAESTIVPHDSVKLHKLVENFVKTNEIWINRTILIDDKSASREYNKIEFF